MNRSVVMIHELALKLMNCCCNVHAIFADLVDAVVAVLLHPNSAARVSAAWCLRCICLALPSQLHPLITRCCDRLDALKSSPEAIAGYRYCMV